MTTWGDLQAEYPELMATAATRIDKQIVFLGTIRKDGSPRVHPVRPFVAEDGRLIIFSSPGSPKTADLRRDGRMVLHANFDRAEKTGGELLLSGEAHELDADDRAAVAGAAPFDVGPGILFHISLLRLVGLFEVEPGVTARVRWNGSDGYVEDRFG